MRALEGCQRGGFELTKVEVRPRIRWRSSAATRPAGGGREPGGGSAPWASDYQVVRNSA